MVQHKPSLISAFASGSEDCTKLDQTLQEQCSPKLPCSVSRWRGKDYKNRKWGQTNEKVICYRQHPSNNIKDTSLSTISMVERVSSERTGSGKSPIFGGSQSDLVEKSSLTVIDAKHDHSELSLGLQILYVGLTSFKTAESSSTSTITYGGSEIQHQKSLEISSQVPVQTSRFLSELKISLMKSCATRQASRVQVFERRQSEGQKSSSSKSSVGSSLTHGFDGKDLIIRYNKDMTPGSRYVPRDTMTSSNKVKIAKPSPTTNAKLRTGRSKSFKEQNIQGKVQQRTAHSKVLAPHSVKNRSTAANMKWREKALGMSSAAAKENLLSRKLPTLD